MEWQLIETAPKDGTIVLLWGIYCSNICACMWQRTEWVVVCDGGVGLDWQNDCGSAPCTFDVPSHWMPLPEPPK